MDFSNTIIASISLTLTISNSKFSNTNMITSSLIILVKTKQQASFFTTIPGLDFENMSRTIANHVLLVCAPNHNDINLMVYSNNFLSPIVPGTRSLWTLLKPF